MAASGTTSGWDTPTALTRGAALAWPCVGVIMMVFGYWQAGLAVLMLTGPFLAFLWGGRLAARRRDREQRRATRRAARDRRVAPDGLVTDLVSPGRTSPAGAAGRKLAAVVVRAETSGGRLDAESLDLVRAIAHVLRPLLAASRAQTSSLDVLTRRDIDAIATEHLPDAIEAYLALPASSPVGPDSSGPSRGTSDRAGARGTRLQVSAQEELHAQLTLLLEGCCQLRQAVVDADVARQQELGRYLADKFGRSSLTLS